MVPWEPSSQNMRFLASRMPIAGIVLLRTRSLRRLAAFGESERQSHATLPQDHTAQRRRRSFETQVGTSPFGWGVPIDFLCRHTLSPMKRDEPSPRRARPEAHGEKSVTNHICIVSTSKCVLPLLSLAWKRWFYAAVILKCLSHNIISLSGRC